MGFRIFIFPSLALLEFSLLSIICVISNGSSILEILFWTFECAVECFGYIVCVCVLGGVHSNIYSGWLNFFFPFLSERIMLLVLLLFLAEFPWKPEHFRCLHVCERGSSAVNSRWWATSLQQSISSPACCAVLSSQFPLSELQCRKCLATGESSELRWGHGRAWASHPAQLPDIGILALPDVGTWRMLKHLWNYHLLMSRVQSSGTLACLCSASSRGGGPAGAHSGIRRAQGLMYWKRMHGAVCLLSFRAERCWGTHPRARVEQHSQLP